MSPVIVHRDTKIGWATSLHDAQLGMAVPDKCSTAMEEIMSMAEDFNVTTAPHLQPFENGELVVLIERFNHLFAGENNLIQ